MPCSGILGESSQGRSQGLKALASTAPAVDQPPASPSADSDAEGDPMTAAARMQALDAAIDMLQDGMGSDIRHQGANHNVIGADIELYEAYVLNDTACRVELHIVR